MLELLGYIRSTITTNLYPVASRHSKSQKCLDLVMIVIVANCKLQYNYVCNEAVLYLWNCKIVSFYNKFLRTNDFVSSTDRNLFLSHLLHNMTPPACQSVYFRSTKFLSGEISTSNHSLYFVAVNWYQITGCHAVIISDTHSNLKLTHTMMKKNVPGLTHVQLDCHDHI